MTKEIKEIEKLIPGLEKQVCLRDYTTFKIGGRAKYFFATKKTEDLISVILIAKEFGLPFFILGSGSNLLIADSGFDGLVIKVNNKSLKVENDKIIAEAGVILGQLVNVALKHSLTGLEWAVGIPGTIGGAVYGNAGAFGKAIGDSVLNVKVFDIKTGKIKKISKKTCRFGYRNSLFKKNKNLVILQIALKLKKSAKVAIEEEMKANLNYKAKTQPLNFPSAGCVFQNPKELFAGKLIENCGLKGKMIGNAKISEKHSNFIINLGKGEAKDVKKLINLVKNKVKKKFGLNLIEEIQYLGFKNRPKKKKF